MKAMAATAEATREVTLPEHPTNDEKTGSL